MVHVTTQRTLRRMISSALVLRRARAMMRDLDLSAAELSIVLTTDRQIQKLNKIYRKKDRPTDVLSFPMLEGPSPADGDKTSGRLLGDIVISVPTARRQAQEKGVSLATEVTELLAHGLLHLLGWDHDTDAKDRRMRKETSRLCVVASEKRAR
jgi:probable rRNA maturation factor